MKLGELVGAAAITPGLRRAVQLVDPDLPLMDVRSQREQIDEITTSERIFANLTGGFGVLALAVDQWLRIQPSGS